MFNQLRAKVASVLMIFAISVLGLSAQNKPISGTVTDASGVPVIGAAVSSVTSSIGTEVSKKVTGKKSNTTAKDIAGKAVGAATRKLTRTVLGTLLK